MPKILAVKHECSRCTREWYVDFEERQEPPAPPSFKMTMSVPPDPDITVDYPSLCPGCAKTVSNNATSIARQLAHKSPKRAKKKPSEEGPSESAPPVRQPSSRASSRTSSAGSTGA